MSNNPFSEAFKSFSQFPGVDAKKNAESFQAASQAVAQGLQDAFQKQADIFQKQADDAAKVLKAVSSASSPAEGASQLSEAAKTAFEKSLSDSKEVIDIAQKANAKAADIINKQAKENFDSLTKQAPKKTAA